MSCYFVIWEILADVLSCKDVFFSSFHLVDLWMAGAPFLLFSMALFYWSVISLDWLFLKGLGEART